MNLYREPRDAGNAHRERYLAQLRKLLQREQSQAKQRRREDFKLDVSSLRAYESSIKGHRARFFNLLGWPLTEPYPGGIPLQKEISAGQDDLGSIRRVWVETLPGLETYGLLFLPPGDGPHPLVISQHGGGGTPELCSDFFGSANYNEMSRRILRRGAAVFCPQLAMWKEEFGPEHERQDLDRNFKQLGGSIAALDIFQVRRCIDAIAARPDIDATRIGMIGLSWGGFYTLVTAASDTRIRVALTSCFFNDRARYPRGPSVWKDAALVAFDAEIAALVCPRALYIEVGRNDELFAVDSARAEAEQVQALYQRLDLATRFRYHEHAGGHEFDPDDPGITFVAEQLALPPAP